MSRLLILTPQLPYPPHQGTSLRNFNILRGLSSNHSITLLSFLEGDQSGEPQAIGPLLDICREVLVIPTPPRRSTIKRLLQMASSTKPDMALRLQSDQFTHALRSILSKDKLDIVQIEGIEMAFTLPIIRELKPQIKIVFDAHNAEAVLQKRASMADRSNPLRWPAAFYSTVQSRRLLALETEICNKVDWVTAVSEPDRHTLLNQLPGGKVPVSVIPNCIDVLSYATDVRQGQDSQEDAYHYDLLFSGKMDYRPNVDAVLWFADEVWPEIIRQRPGTTWAIVGQKPHSRLNRLQQLPGVVVTGWVDQVQPYLAGAKVFIMPFRVGSGTRLKLIEAFAAGKAVVSTPLGVEGFPVHNGRDLMLASAPSGLAQSTLTLLNDPTFRQKLGSNGQAFAKNYDWRVVVPEFERVYLELLAK